jgi:ATP-dependent DNA ligase
MKATTARLPVGAGWVYELKWDGMRAVVEVGIGDPPVRIWSARLPRAAQRQGPGTVVREP